MVRGEGTRILGERLDADVVRSCVAMFLEAGGDGRFVAPDHERVDEAVAAALGEIVVSETLTLPVVGVVR